MRQAGINQYKNEVIETLVINFMINVITNIVMTT